MSGDTQRVADRLRRWREESDLSLQGLAARCDVAASTIQKIERQQMVPTIAVLLKIARGLNRKPSDFLDDHREPEEVAHRPADGRRRYPDGHGGQVEPLHGKLIDQRFETYKIEQAPASALGKFPVEFLGEQLMLGLKGELRVFIDEDEFALSPGDTLHWKDKSRVSWENRGSTPAEFLIAGTLRQDFAGMLRPAVPVGTVASDDPEDGSR